MVGGHEQDYETTSEGNRCARAGDLDFGVVLFTPFFLAVAALAEHLRRQHEEALRVRFNATMAPTVAAARLFAATFPFPGAWSARATLDFIDARPPDVGHTGPDGGMLRTVPLIVDIDAVLRQPLRPSCPVTFARSHFATMTPVIVSFDPLGSRNLWRRIESFHAAIIRSYRIEFRHASLALNNLVVAYSEEVAVLSSQVSALFSFLDKHERCILTHACPRLERHRLSFPLLFGSSLHHIDDSELAMLHDSDRDDFCAMSSLQLVSRRRGFLRVGTYY